MHLFTGSFEYYKHFDKYVMFINISELLQLTWPIFVQVVVSIIGLLLFGKFLEPLWGSKELSKFIFIVNFSTSCVFMTAIVLYYVTVSTVFLLSLENKYFGIYIRSGLGVLTIWYFSNTPIFGFMGFYQDCWWALNSFYLI